MQSLSISRTLRQKTQKSLISCVLSNSLTNILFSKESATNVNISLKLFKPILSREKATSPYTLTLQSKLLPKKVTISITCFSVQQSPNNSRILWSLDLMFVIKDPKVLLASAPVITLLSRSTTAQHLFSKKERKLPEKLSRKSSSTPTNSTKNITACIPSMSFTTEMEFLTA